ncbi:MAG: quinone-dependent dihydroorotate dehydrogenase [Bacteroidales bacterium]|nr:quinone-dependent dihydroorotate dehydrogenase [Bacteroidales bacterium]
MFYKPVIRPLLFRLQPERVHHLVAALLKAGFAIPGIAPIVKATTSVKHPALRRNLFGLEFKNPVGVAAGFDKEARLYRELDILGFGFVEVGTVTPKGQPGNPQPRLFRLPTDKGLINRMGFNNHGVEAAINRLKNRKPGMIVGGNLGKNTLTPNETAVEDYVILFEKLFDYVDYFVINVSCPNISNLQELQDSEALMEIASRLQNLNNAKPKRKPILIKVSPDLNFGQLDDVIEIVIKTKIDGVIAVNTTITRDNLKTSEEKIKAIGRGGLSGKPISNRALEVVRYLKEQSKNAFPVIGVGGIFTPDDALKMLDAGADLIQVYTGFIYEGPFIAKKINKAILKRLLKDS